MAAPQKNLVKFAGIAMIALLMGIVVFRYITGTTTQDMQKAREEKERLEKIANASKGDGKELSAIFDKQRAEALKEENERLKRQGNKPVETPAAEPVEDPNLAKIAAEQRAQLQAELREREKLELAIRSSKLNAFDASGETKAGNVAPISLNALLGTNAQGQGNAAPTGAQLSQASMALAQQNAPGTNTNTNNQEPSKSSREIDQANQRFLLAQNANSTTPLTPVAATSIYTLHQGSGIPAVLINAIDAELPGEIKAQVTMNVYDSIALKHLLIPKGSILIGQYSSEVSVGQQRLLFGFERLIFPNGASVELLDRKGRSNFKGADRMGASGLTAEVDNRFWQIFGPSLLIGAFTAFSRPISDWLFPVRVKTSSENDSSTTTVTTEKTDPITGEKTTTTTVSNKGNTSASSSNQTNNNLQISLATAASDTLTTAITDTSKRILDRYQNIKPNLRLAAGTPFTMVVARDLVLPPSITRKSVAQ